MAGQLSGPIESARNPRVLAAADLRDRRERDRRGQILIDGAREILRAIQAGIRIDEVFACPSLCRSDDCRAVLAAASEAGIAVTEVGERAFEKVAFGDRAEGVVAVARPPSVELSRLSLPSEPLVVVLEAVEKPGNLGAIARTADGAGVDAIVVADPRCDLFNPNAIRASLGTLFAVPLARAAADEARDWLLANGIRVVAARVDGATALAEADLRGALAIVLGSEASGLSEAWTGTSVEAVRLPMLGVADSLNVSAAAAVLLYEARRQRDASGSPQRPGDPAPQRPANPASKLLRTTRPRAT